MLVSQPIPALHNEYKSWMNELDFYYQELSIFQLLLQNNISKNSTLSSDQKVAELKKEFLHLKEMIHLLKLELDLSEKDLAGFVKTVSGLGLDDISFDNHNMLREDMEEFRNNYRILKEDFRDLKLK